MADLRLCTLRPSSLEARGVVARPDLLDLLRAGNASPWPLPRWRHRSLAAGARQQWHTHPSGLRGDRARLLLRSLWRRGATAWRTSLRTQRSRRHAHTSASSTTALAVEPQSFTLVKPLLEMDRPKSRLIWLLTPMSFAFELKVVTVLLHRGPVPGATSDGPPRPRATTATGYTVSGAAIRCWRGEPAVPLAAQTLVSAFRRVRAATRAWRALTHRCGSAVSG